MKSNPLHQTQPADYTPAIYLFLSVSQSDCVIRNVERERESCTPTSSVSPVLTGQTVTLHWDTQVTLGQPPAFQWVRMTKTGTWHRSQPQTTSCPSQPSLVLSSLIFVSIDIIQLQCFIVVRLEKHKYRFLFFFCISPELFQLGKNIFFWK